MGCIERRRKQQNECFEEGVNAGLRGIVVVCERTERRALSWSVCGSFSGSLTFEVVGVSGCK